jgi:hypothetical protein
MTAGRWNITMEQGALFSYTLYVRNAAGALVDLTNYVARMRVYDDWGGTKICEFFESGQGEHLGLIVNGGTAGTLTLSMTAVDTAVITEESGVYEIELLPIDSWTAILQPAYATINLVAASKTMTSTTDDVFLAIESARGAIGTDEDLIYIKVSGCENTGEDSNNGVYILTSVTNSGVTHNVLTMTTAIRGANNTDDTAMTISWGRSEEDNVVRLLQGNFRLAERTLAP